MNTELPRSPACERNQGPILEVLRSYLTAGQTVLEIGHGTGQHAFFLAPALQVKWWPTDRPEHSWVIEERQKITPCPLVAPSQTLVVGAGSMREQLGSDKTFHGVFSANTAHIMSWPEVQALCREVGELLRPQGYFFLYGPFQFQGQFVGPNNQAFDRELRARDPAMGLRSLEAIQAELKPHGLLLQQSFALPAFNHLLVFQRWA